MRCVGEKSRGEVHAFTRLCCQSNRLRAAGGCATCDMSSDEKADKTEGKKGERHRSREAKEMGDLTVLVS